MTTFWIDVSGRMIGATSEPDATLPGAVDSTEVPPEAPRFQTWDGGAWVDDADRAAQEQRKTDLGALREGGKDLALVLVELIDWTLANTAMRAVDFTPQVRQAYLDLKAIAERVKT